MEPYSFNQKKYLILTQEYDLVYAKLHNIETSVSDYARLQRRLEELEKEIQSEFTKATEEVMKRHSTTFKKLKDNGD